MKKKSLLAIMLIALVLTLGFMVSCQPDPDPDELAGTWIYIPAPNYEVKLVCDGFGSYTFTTTYNGVVTDSESGQYSLDNGFVVIDRRSEMETHSSSQPMYVYAHPIDASHAHLGFQETTGTYVYSSDPESPNYENYFQDPYSISGTKYTNSFSTFDVSGGTIKFSSDEQYKVAGVTVYEFISEGTATYVANPGYDGENYSTEWYLKFYSEQYSKATERNGYAVSGSTLSICWGGMAVDFNKQ